MEYQAIVTREGDSRLVEFPDCPGCQTFARKGQDLGARAREALEGWLEVALEDGEAPPRPGRVRAHRGEQLLSISIAPQLAVSIAIRWARLDAKLTQAQLAQRAGVTQQQIAKLERPDANPTIETLQKVADALGAELGVSLEPRHAAIA